MDIGSRKNDHLNLCRTGDVGFRGGTLLSEVQLIHNALPELALGDLDTTTQLFGRTLQVPLLIAAMTGGSDEAARVNRALSQIAEKRGYAFGLGSQRAMWKSKDLRPSYDVRAVAKDVCLLGNIGGAQACTMGAEAVAKLAADVGADAMCVHLNPAMELVQDDGDRDFTGILQTLSDLVLKLPVPVVAKETGSGISLPCGRQLQAAGIRHVDVSGAGGTSWVGVETRRAEASGRAPDAALGEEYWEWGIPTGASVAMLAPLAFDTLIATGGIGTGLDVARALALGARVVGIARPVLQALHDGGETEVHRLLDRMERSLRTAMLLTGSRTPTALRHAPKMLGPTLRAWVAESAETA